MNSYEEIAELFLKMEKQEQLFKYKLDGVVIWELIRVAVFEELEQKIYHFGAGHPNSKRTGALKRLSGKVKILELLCTKNAFFNRKNSKYLVFRHRRRINIEGKNIEVNTNYLEKIIKDLNSDNTEYIEKGIAFGNRNIVPDSQFLMVNPIKNFIGIYLYKFLNKVTKNYSILNEINHIIYSYFEIHMDITNLALQNLVWFKNMYKLCYKYFSLKKPEGIYIVCAYGEEGLIKAARDLKITTYEIQHGIITKYHFGYAFPETEDVPYFPDKLIVYGDYWKTAAAYPIDEENVMVLGNPYLEIQLKKYAKVLQEPFSILFISSGKSGEDLSVLASEFADQAESFTVYYKLHPSEYSVWKEIYPAINNKNRNNLIVIEDEINLYELFARNRFIIGVNSTALFESFAFSPNLILLNTPGVQYINNIIEKFNIPLINNVNELISTINNYPKTAEIKRDYFYKDISSVI